jgi:hypothetical protein
MVNCVYADADDVLDKVDHLFSNPDRLQEITDAGFRLVHARHTAAQRRQVRDWYDLWSETGSADGIVQEHPLAALTRSGHPRVLGDPQDTGEDRILIRRGWDAMQRGRHAAATRAFVGASNFQYMPEAEVGKAFNSLLSGDAAAADATIVTLLDHNDRLYGPVDPDPVQWATYLRSLLCQGRVEDARTAAELHPAVRHPELERVRAVLARLTGEPPSRTAAPPRASVSPLPPLAWPRWVDGVRDMLAANGRPELADGIAGLGREPDPAAQPQPADAPPTPTGRPEPDAGPAGGDGGPLWYVAAARALLGEQTRSAARRWVTTQWLDALNDVAEREELDTVLVVGPSRFSLRERSLRLAAARNPRMPEVVRLDPDQVGSISLDDGRTLVHLSGRVPLTEGVAERLGSARVVVVEGVLRPGVVRLVDELMGSGEFEIVDHATAHGGYYVLRHRLGRPAPATTHPAPAEARS